jgi:hypothetical protein
MTMLPTSAPETIVLKGGTVISLPALRVLWDLEARGLDIRLGTDGRILVGPNALLDDTDRDLIRQHKAELIRLVRYCEAIQ